jgi:hypothetical protein
LTEKLPDLRAAGKITRSLAVYGGDERLRDGSVEVLPVKEFMKDLAAGRVLP